MVICDMCATRKSSMNRKQAVGLLPVCRLNFAPLLVDTSSLLFVVNSHFHIYRVRIIKHVRTKEREREKGLRIKYHWFAEKEGNRIFCWQRKTLRPHRFISGAEKWTHSKNVWGKEFRLSDNDFYFFPLDLIFFSSEFNVQYFKYKLFSSFFQRRADRRHDRGEMSSAGGLFCSGRTGPQGALEAPGWGWKGRHNVHLFICFHLFLLYIFVVIGPAGRASHRLGGHFPRPWWGSARGLHLHRENVGRTLCWAQRWTDQQPSPVPLL